MRRRILRYLKKSLVLCAVGVVLSVLVAWGSVLVAGAGSTVERQQLVQHAESRYRWTFTVEHDSSWAADRYVAHVRPRLGGGEPRSAPFVVPEWARDWAVDRPDRGESTGTEWIEGRGWPVRMLSFRAVRIAEDRGDLKIPEAIRLYIPERFDVRDGILLELKRARALDERFPVAALPFRPIWRGIAINALLYAGAIGIVGAGVHHGRRWRRRRGGRCVGCGYETRGLSICPECGHAAVVRMKRASQH